MEYTKLGSAGVKVSRICLGTMSFGKAEWMIELDKAKPIVEKAIDLGINFFDTANVYSFGRSEEILGEALKGRREDVFIATKLCHPMSEAPNGRGLSRYHMMKQIEGSLRRLQTDHVDLYQTHRWDYDTPIEETLRGFDDLVHQGKIRYIGGSSMFAWQFSKALYTSKMLGLVHFVTMQNLYNLCYREEEREMIPLCKDQGIGLIPWSPLARGFLTGKYERNQAPASNRFKSDKPLSNNYFRSEDFDILDRVKEIAKQKGVTPSQVSLAWVLHKGVTAPILGATKVEHVESAVASLEVKLSSDDMKYLEELYKPRRIVGHA